MRVFFATSECVPFFKLGGLADVSHALPVALSQIGVSVTIALPYYEQIKVQHRDGTCVGPLAVDFAGKRELVFIFKSHIPNAKIDVLLFRHPRLLQYHDYNFQFYCACLATYLKQPLTLPFDIIHCHDWHTALLPVLLGEDNKTKKKQSKTLQSKRYKTILTIHNLLYQGVFTVGRILDTGIPLSVLHKIPSREGGVINSFREGLEHADVITTVSPSYAKEIITPAFGEHMYEVLRRRHDRVVGILNGIDAWVWDPKTDPNIPVNFSLGNVLEGKKENKKRLQKAVGLPESDVCLFGFVGRIEPNQKGVDLIMEAAKRMPEDHFQVVLLGTGEKKQVAALTLLDTKKGNISYVSTFDERLARRIFAGSDVILVPSKFEPCGLTQMIAMRYGAIPLVRKTGGLADSVEDGKTGFVFDAYIADQLCQSMWRAIVMREDAPKEWLSMMKRAMKADFSWKHSAKEYKDLYTTLMQED
jgi:starch synthase